MSKVAAYLQEHILGEVTTNPAILEAMSTDASVLKISPEMVIYPRVTNDVRKVARFAWQLAEKGHVLPITVRGGGSDETGAAIGKGIVLSFPAHMSRVLELAGKQKLVRVQPGAGTLMLNSALGLEGLAIPALPMDGYGTVGGAVAGDASSQLSGKYGTTGEWVHQLEVVLANGDILQTERLSKRELNRKKGLQTLEGEIYRGIDSLIEDNAQLIEEKLADGAAGKVGYASIADVKNKDGSFDLTPLIAGSQGTLGIISEMIMKTEFTSTHMAAAVMAFPTGEAARDALDQLRALDPARLDYFDGELFATAAAQGKTYDFAKEIADVRAVIVAGFDDFSDRARARHLKKINKMFANSDVVVKTADGDDADELLAASEVTAFAVNPATRGASAPPLFDGAYVPSERLEDFLAALWTLGEKYHVTLPVHGRALEDLYFTRPQLQLKKVSDKQKVFKLLEEYSNLVAHYGGNLIGDGGEGRVKARFAYAQLDNDVQELFKSIKAVFDPYGILNPGVKQTSELRQLASALRSDYDTAAFSRHVPYN